MTKALVVGASGLLGSRLMAEAAKRFDSVAGTYAPDADKKPSWRLEKLDIGSKEEVERLLEKVRPDLVLLAAAMTDVDACEKAPQLAARVNSTGPELVARTCKRLDAKLVFISTDYVFDGAKSRRYTEEDAVRPISVYGSTKLAGERAVLSTLPGSVVVRPAVLYGWSPPEVKDNFVTWVLKKLRNGERATLFRDQRISPTFADDLAKTILELDSKGVSGVWHASGPDCLDRPACGSMIAKVFGCDPALVVPVLSSSVTLPARRPAYSCLDVSKVEELLNRKMVSFEDGLKAMKAQEKSSR